MKVLVGKTFGIGNACLAIPMIKAIASLGHDVDVLVGTLPDDFGAFEVFNAFKRNGGGIREIHRNRVLTNDSYDVAIMAIPYDGRWMNGRDFVAAYMMDCRKRPGNIDRLGFDMWEKHEVEYMMENARELGFQGETPNGSFLEKEKTDPDLVYLGLGYKRDSAGFGISKHFGNKHYYRLIEMINYFRPGTKFVSSGPMIDFVECAQPIRNIVHIDYDYEHVLTSPGSPGFETSFELISRCHAYIGNDTGMMHIAASLGIPTMGLFAYNDLLRKNPPFCEKSKAIHFSNDQTQRRYDTEDLALEFINFAWGK